MTKDQLSRLHEHNIEQLRAGSSVVHGDTLFTSVEEYQAATSALGDKSPETTLEAMSSESKPHETTFVLIPGSAVYRSDGLLPIVSGGQSAPNWCAPGDFKLFLEPGEAGSRSDGLVRELLVGGFRQPEGGDFELTQGTFLDDPGWESVVGSLQTRVFELERQIGFLAGTEQAADQLPRGESWLAERADSDAKLAELEGELAAAQERIKELETTAAQPVDPEGTPKPSEASEPVVEPAPKKPK